MTLHQLLLFQKVVECGNFSLAAKKLNLTGMAVSNQIHALEAELEITLMHHKGRRVRLTQAGQQVYEQAKSILHKTNDLKNYAKSFSQQPKGKLNIAYQQGIGGELLFPLLADFCKTYENINLNLMAKSFNEQDKTEDYDVIFAVPEKVAGKFFESWHCRPLVNLNYCLCASEQYLKIHKAPLELNDLTQHCYLLQAERLQDQLMDAFQKHDLTFKQTIAFNDTQAVAQGARHHLGIALLPELYLINHNLKMIKNIINIGPLLVYLLFKKTAHPSPILTAFLEYVSANINAVMIDLIKDAKVG